MDNLALYMIGSFAAFLCVAACVLLTKHLIDTRPSFYCEDCGKILRRSVWFPSEFNPNTGAVKRWSRFAWCATQLSDTVPIRPTPLGWGELGRPLDIAFAHSHRAWIEHVSSVPKGRLFVTDPYDMAMADIIDPSYAIRNPERPGPETPTR